MTSVMTSECRALILCTRLRVKRVVSFILIFPRVTWCILGAFETTRMIKYLVFVDREIKSILTEAKLSQIPRHESICIFNTVDSCYLDLAYLELPFISKWKIWRLQKHENLTTYKIYCGKEEKLLLRSNFSSFPQYFQYISNFKSPITQIFVKCG